MGLLPGELLAADEEGPGVRLAGRERALGLGRGVQESLPPLGGILPLCRGLRRPVELEPFGPLVDALGGQERYLGPERPGGGPADEGDFDVPVAGGVTELVEGLRRLGPAWVAGLRPQPAGDEPLELVRPGLE